MIVVDSSVVVAAFATWHAAHAEAADVVRAQPRLPAHAALEAYSVLTRMPEPNRAPPAVVHEFLAGNFRDPWLTLDGDDIRSLVAELVRVGISGGPTYDALIAATARAAAGTLYTCDRRAGDTCQRLGVDVRFVGQPTG